MSARFVHPYWRRAATVVVVAVIIPVLLGCAALSVDIGYLFNVRLQLQNTADAAALAGAQLLHDEYAARSAAHEYALTNFPSAGQVLADNDLYLGNWNTEQRVFTEGGTPLNAVRVTTRRSTTNGNPVDLFFASIFGIFQSDVWAEAIAVGTPLRTGVGSRFLIDDDMFDTDVPVIEDLAARLDVTTDDLLSDNDGDWFIDLPPGEVLELPTGQVGDSAIYDAIHPEFPFGTDTWPSHLDFLNYNEDGSWRDVDSIKAMLDPLLGVYDVDDPSRYESFVNPNLVHVSPIFHSDLSNLNPAPSPLWADGIPAVNALGIRRGLLAFKIIGVGLDPDGPGGSVLPNLIIQIVDPSFIDLSSVSTVPVYVELGPGTSVLVL